MKKFMMSVVLLWSWESFSAPIASMDYSCELDGEQRSGKVMIDDQSITGVPSCLDFKKVPGLCFLFERRVNIHDLYFSLSYAKNNTQNRNINPISLSNIPFREGALSLYFVKSTLGKQKELSCTFTNVVWETF
jgi:hypothetical protein